MNTQWTFPFTNDWMHHLIGYSMDFGRSLIGRSSFARWGRGTGWMGTAPRAQKCFDRLGNDQIHWISNQMMHSIVGKGENPLSIQSNDWFQAFGKGEKAFSTYIAYSSYDLSLYSFECCTACIVRFVIRRLWGQKSMKRVSCESKVACKFS